MLLSTFALTLGAPPDAGAPVFDFELEMAPQAAAIDVPTALPWVLLAVVVIVFGIAWARTNPSRVKRRPPTGTGTSSLGE